MPGTVHKLVRRILAAYCLQLVRAFQYRDGQANLPSQAVYQLSIRPGQPGPPARPGLAAVMATVMVRQVPWRVLRVGEWTAGLAG